MTCPICGAGPLQPAAVQHWRHGVVNFAPRYCLWCHLAWAEHEIAGCPNHPLAYPRDARRRRNDVSTR